MRFGFIGDIVGRVGRECVREYAKAAKEAYKIDCLIANGENASHGFGLSHASMLELAGYGIDIFTGGNHSWDKKDIIPSLQEPNSPILRPHNYPLDGIGSGIYRGSFEGELYAVVNLMGYFGMPQCENAFVLIKKIIQELKAEGFVNIILDFHADATSEKRAMFMMLKGSIGAILGTHTHVGTDDLEIFDGTFGVSDVGMSGARESVLGMDSSSSIERCLSGLPVRLSVPVQSHIPKVFQMVVFELQNGRCIEAFKLKAIDGKELKKTLQADLVCACKE